MFMNYLFRDYSLHDVLASKLQAMKRKIDDENPDYLSNVNLEEYLSYLYNQFALSTPVIDEGSIIIDKHECPVERYNDYYTKINDVDGVALYIRIPYSGNKDLFLARPSAYTTGFPQAGINNEYIVIEIGLSMKEVEEYDVKNVDKDSVFVNSDKYLDEGNKFSVNEYKSYYESLHKNRNGKCLTTEK